MPARPSRLVVGRSLFANAPSRRHVRRPCPGRRLVSLSWPVLRLYPRRLRPAPGPSHARVGVRISAGAAQIVHPRRSGIAHASLGRLCMQVSFLAQNALPSPSVAAAVAAFLLSKRRIAALTASAAVRAPAADDPRQPAADTSVLSPARLRLRLSVVVDLSTPLEGEAGDNAARRPHQASARPDRGSAPDKRSCLGVDRGGADNSAGVAKNGVHVLETDAARLGVEEVDCQKRVSCLLGVPWRG